MKKIWQGIFIILFLSIFCINMDSAKANSYYNNFVQEGNSWYYYDNNGVKATSAWIYVDGTYFVDDYGRLAFGAKEIDGKVYNFDSTGKLSNDWLTLENGKYVMASGNKIINKQFINGNYHFYYDEHGDVITGFHQLNGNLYYLTGNGFENDGFRIIDNAWRYVFRNGRIAMNEFISIGNERYYFDELGRTSYGFKNINGHIYYFNDRGVMQSGIKLIDNAWRYFDQNGMMKINEWFNIGHDTYYAKTDGSLTYGVAIIDNKTYYFDGSGTRQTGMLLVNGTWRYFDSNGIMKDNEWFNIGNSTYYAQAGGSLSYNATVIDGIVYHFNQNAELIDYTEWVYDSKGAKLLENGKYVTNEFRTVNGDRYYMKADGYRATGLTNYQGSFFYFNPDGVMQKNKFINVGGGWRYFNSDGIMPTNMWIYLDAEIYRTDSNGFLMYGWHVIDGEQYFFNTIGQKKRYSYGADISEHNGKIDWHALKQNNVSFVIIRSSFGDSVLGRADYNFKTNYLEAKNNGLKSGIYHYSYSTTVQDAVNEANHVLSLIKDKSFDTPIYFDIEDPSQSNLSNAQLTAIIDAFCTTIEKAGYKAGVYASLYWLNNKINPWVLQGRSVWVAQWNDTCDYTGLYSMWQYTSDFYINGKRFDMNIWYF